MRVAHSLPTAGVGLALLATFGFAGQSKQLQTKQPRPGTAHPVESITIEPTRSSWAEMLHTQATMPLMAFMPVAVDATLPDPAPIELPALEGLDRVRPAAIPTHEAMGACASVGTEPTLNQNFLAQADVPDGGAVSYIPPDVAGDVGPDHLMSMHNNKTSIRNRIGGSVASVDTSVFWGGIAGGLLTSPTYPRVIFDALGGRWLASARDGVGSLGNTRLLFAISDTNDPTGAWSLYAIVADGTSGSQADWITMGSNATWVALSANMFNLAGSTFLGAKLWVIDMATAVVPGGPLTISVFATGYPTVSGFNTSSHFPSRAYDTSDPNMYLISNPGLSSGGVVAIQGFSISGTGPAPVVNPLPGSPFGATAGFFLVVNNFSQTQRTMAQLTEPRFITAFSTRTSSVCLRNSRVWFAHSGGLPGPAANTSPTQTGVLWYQINPAALPAPIIQSGVITGGANTMYTVPSIAVNCGDDAIVGFSNGDATKHPEASYAIHLGSAALGSTEPVRLLKAGQSTYWKNFGVGTTAQWGRYSSSSVDPVDDRAFWTIQEYAAQRVGGADNDSRWGTWWGRIGDCGAPVVTDDPDPVTVCVGDPASFSVAGTAFVAPLTYQWRKDGVDLPGETASTLSIGATTPGDGGTYDVRVIDGCGSVLSLGALLDFAGAVVNTHPVNQNVPKGGTANFSVVATGSGTLSYVWRKDGVPLVPAETNSTLVVSPVGRQDIGFYDVIVSDVCGPTTSNSAVLSIPFEGKNFGQDSLELAIFKQPESAIVCEGTNHTLSVTAHGENLSYLWRKGGVAIVPAETNATLVLTNIDPSHNGSYDVIVTDNSGFLVSDSVVIDVDDLATITQHPTNVGAQQGDDVTFSVTAVGDGDLTYQWQKGGLIGALNDMPGETGPTLELDNINNQDAGRYRCKVTNHCGTVFSNTAKLTLVQ